MRLLHGGRVSGLLALTLLIPSYATAALPEQISIRWSGAASCPRSPTLEEEIARLLGSDSARVEPMKFDARVESLSPEGYSLTLDVKSRTHRAQRTVQLATCVEVDEAAALLIATAIDPAVALRTEEPSEPEEPEERTPRTPPTWSLTARGLYDWHSLPRPTVGASVGAALRFEHLSLWGEARYLLATTARDEVSQSETAIDLFAGALGAALLFPLGRVTLGPAVEAELGLLRGLSSDVAAPERAQALWGAGFVGALVGVTLHERVALSLTMFAGAPSWRPRFALRDEVPFYTTDPWTFRLALGVRVSLGSR